MSMSTIKYKANIFIPSLFSLSKHCLEVMNFDEEYDNHY